MIKLILLFGILLIIFHKQIQDKFNKEGFDIEEKKDVDFFTKYERLLGINQKIKHEIYLKIDELINLCKDKLGYDKQEKYDKIIFRKNDILNTFYIYNHQISYLDIPEFQNALDDLKDMLSRIIQENINFDEKEPLGFYKDDLYDTYKIF